MKKQEPWMPECSDEWVQEEDDNMFPPAPTAYDMGKYARSRVAVKLSDGMAPGRYGPVELEPGSPLGRKWEILRRRKY